MAGWLTGSDEEVERLWEGEEEEMDVEDKEWLIQRLREKVRDLKSQLRLVSTFGHGNMTGSGSGPVAHIVFFSNTESMDGRYRLEEMMRNLASSVQDTQVQMEAFATYHQPSAVLLHSTGGGEESDGEEEEEEEEEVEEVIVVGSVEYYSGFCLDWRGAPVREIGGGGGGGGGGEGDNWQDVEWKPSEETAVLYGQVYLEPFWVDEVRAREERRLRRMAIVCFNCGDDHHIKDCTEPKDIARINSKRQEFIASLGTQGADRRYHMISADDRFKKFEPGKISERLRKALGLTKETEFPPYIYRMRDLGYPPGYRLQGRDNLRLYNDCNSVEEASASADVKDKENDNGALKKEEVIVYPGFNSPDNPLPSLSYKLGCGAPPPPTSNGNAIRPTSHTEGDKNVEKLKKWLSSSEPAHQHRPPLATATATTTSRQIEQDVDDLGSLSDYEFEEEAETMEDGEEVVGFGLRKLLKTVPPETKNNEDGERSPPKTRKKQFSLDFPPGLVHDESECIKSPKRWKEIKKILSVRKKLGKKELRKRLFRKLCQ